MSDTFKKGKSNAAGLNTAFGAKLGTMNAVMAGQAADIPVGTLAERPVNPDNFTLFGVTDLLQLQVYINGIWYPLTGNTNGATPPSPALNVTGTPSSPNSINLTWQSPTSGTQPFIFSVNYRVTGTTAWTNFTNTQANSANVTGLQAGTQYDFQIVTTGQATPSSVSPIVTVATGYVAPNAPLGLTVGTTTDTTIEVSWSASTSGTAPIAYVAKAVAGTTVVQSPPLSDVSYTFLNLTPSTAYTITVTASNNGGSATSDPTTGTTSASAAQAPNAPTNLTATGITINSFTLGWTASTQGDGISYQPEWAAVSGVGIVREPYDQPGSAQSVWNTPMGSGAVWSNPGELDQDDLTSLSCNVNFGDPWGANLIRGTVSDPLVAITINPDEQGLGSLSLHIPASASIGATGDANIQLIDMTQPNKEYSFGACNYNNGVDWTGGITCARGEVNLTCGLCEDAVTGNIGYDIALGTIRHYDLVQGKIQHALRWASDASIMDGQPPDWTTNIAWPETHADFNKPGYTGHIQPGATIGIPSTVNLDTLGLTTGGRMLADALQQFGAIWRDVATGGVAFTGELQDGGSTLLQQMQSDCPKLLPYLRILRNQGPNSKNGGGTPLYPAPPPLDPTICSGSSGGGSGGAPSTFQPIGQPTTGTSIGIVGLQPNTTYQFEVVATNSLNSATSEIIDVTTAVSGSGGGGGPGTVTTTWDTSNFAGPMTFSSDKLTAFTGGSTTPASTPQGCFSTSGKTTGMFWFEVTASSISTDFAIGIANTNFPLNAPGGLGATADGIGYYPVSPVQAVYYNGQGLTFGNADPDSNGATFTIIVDIDGQQFWATSPAMRASVGATAWNNSLSANPATKSGGISFAGLPGTKFICFSDLEGGAVAVLNTGFTAPSITIPAGVSPWDPGTGGGGGAGSNGTPIMQGPAQIDVAAGSAVNVAGITVADSSATGTCTLNMACSQGTLTATIGGSPVGGSGTSSLSYSNTLSNCQTVAATLVYTAGSSAGSDNIGVTFTDNLSQVATIHIPVTVSVQTNPQLLPPGWFSTLGAQIVDQSGNPVRICSVGWSWYGGPQFGPNSLNYLSYKQMFSALVNASINCIRIGVAMCSINRDDPFPAGSIDFSQNPDLQGKNFNEALQTVITYGRSVGLRFIIDWHNCEGTGTNNGVQPGNGLWYDLGGASNNTDGAGNPGTITQDTYFALQTKLAQMFLNNDGLIGVDLLNEPGFGRNPGCTWGGYVEANGETGVVGSDRDIRQAYQTAGDRLHATNPNLLVICEGVEDYAGQGSSDKYAPEGAVQAAQGWPVQLSTPNKLIYSGHIYPNEVGGANPDSGTGFWQRLTREFGWLYTNNQGPPYWVGEMGDNMRTTDGQTNVGDLIQYLQGQKGDVGGPTFTGNQQGVSWDWWDLEVVQTNGVPQFGILSSNAGGVDSVQQNFWGQMLYVPKSGGGGASEPPLIQAPLSNVAQGTWRYGDYQSIGMPSGAMHYAYLLPSGYSAANTYPVLVYMHQNNEGNGWYQSGGDPTQNTIVFQDVIDGIFNSIQFRTDYPCIVIVPFCDQTDGQGGAGLNFGGYADVPGQNVNENAVAGIAQYFWAKFSCYKPKTYVMGESLGGIGTIAQMLDYNRVNGPIGKVWTAGWCLSGEIVRNPNPINTPSIIDRMNVVPLFCVAGKFDNTPSSGADNTQYEEPAYRHFAGSSNYPEPPGAMGGSVAGCKAGSSLYYYGEDSTLGHGVWSGNAAGHNYGVLPDAVPFLDWLFSQEVA